MSIENQIYAACASAVGGRLFPHKIPEREALPHAAYKLYIGEPINDLSGHSAWDREQWQLDVYGATYDSVRAAAAALRAAMTGAPYAATCDLVQDLYEDEVSQHRVLMLFTVLRTG